MRKAIWLVTFPDRACLWASVFFSDSGGLSVSESFVKLVSGSIFGLNHFFQRYPSPLTLEWSILVPARGRKNTLV